MIPIILTVFNRFDFFKNQLHNLQNQTCVGDIDLHIICNGDKTYFENVCKQFENKLKITLVQRDNSLVCWERHAYAFSQNFEYYILLDDDMLLEENFITIVYSNREKNCLKSFWLRTFDHSKFSNKDTYTSCKPETNIYIDKEYNYGGCGFSIIDFNILKCAIDNFETVRQSVLNDTGLKLELFDDIYMSWIVNKYNFKIKSHQSWPKMIEDETRALYNKIWNKKDILTNYLHTIHQWKKI